MAMNGHHISNACTGSDGGCEALLGCIAQLTDCHERMHSLVSPWESDGLLLCGHRSRMTTWIALGIRRPLAKLAQTSRFGICCLAQLALDMKMCQTYYEGCIDLLLLPAGWNKPS